MSLTARCPCRKKTETRVFGSCCAMLLAGERTAPSAEALMRSRYTAYVFGREDYLLATWHPTTRPQSLELAADQAWVMLKVHVATEDGDHATVHFTARWRKAGRTGALEELSRFLREDGRWFYVDGNGAS
jgi:SEC-C motif-containing protein